MSIGFLATSQLCFSTRDISIRLISFVLEAQVLKPVERAEYFPIVIGCYRAVSFHTIRRVYRGFP